MERVLPTIADIVDRHAERTVFTRFITPNSLKLQERRKAFSPIRKVRAISQKLYSHSQPPNPLSV